MKKHLKILGITTVLVVTMGLLVGASTALAAKGGNVIGPGGSHTITESGNYKVKGTVEGIVVNASNVHINLSQGTVDCPNLSSVGILVDNQQNVHINASLTGTVKNCAIGIHLTGGGGIHHINGVILRSNSTGISLGQQSNKNHINGNDSSSNGFHGILVATDKNHINGNTTNDNGSQGIVAVGSSTNNHINGNTAFGNGFATTPANGADLADTTNCDTNRWNSNDFGTKREECIS